MNVRTLARITLPLACFTALTQAARTVMSTIGPALAIEYSLTAAQLGAFSAALFASYWLAQLPAGVAVDRWGPRYVQTFLGVVATLGFGLCALASGPKTFLLARLITGVGISTGLIGMLKGNSQWFASQDVARATGFGMVIAAAEPFLRFAPVAALMTVLNFTYLGLWAGPWLRDVGHFDGKARAEILLLYTAGLFIGGPLMGTLVSIAQGRRYHPMTVPMICTVGLIIVQILLAVAARSAPEIAILWLLFAVLSACGPAAYAAVGSAFSPAQSGRVSTAVNTLTLGLVFAMQIVIGHLVGAWPTLPNGNWSPNGYAFGLLVTIVLQAVTLIWAWTGIRAGARQRRSQPA